VGQVTKAEGPLTWCCCMQRTYINKGQEHVDGVGSCFTRPSGLDPEWSAVSRENRVDTLISGLLALRADFPGGVCCRGAEPVLGHDRLQHRYSGESSSYTYTRCLWHAKLILLVCGSGAEPVLGHDRLQHRLLGGCARPGGSAGEMRWPFRYLSASGSTRLTDTDSFHEERAWGSCGWVVGRESGVAHRLLGAAPGCGRIKTLVCAPLAADDVRVSVPARLNLKVSHRVGGTARERVGLHRAVSGGAGHRDRGWGRAALGGAKAAHRHREGVLQGGRGR
jgi:hypothetical protein